ncbi:MAG TPA: inositol monophosphatase family protein [Candidatus Eisenbacteria bacterium]|nr:inositol monophosphatase family protein [Candidatus Eisenbacteria bacterium]
MTGPFERELQIAERVAREAGALLKENFGRAQEVQYKGRIDLVTEMDRRSEDLIVGRLRAAFPGDGVWAEESGRDRAGAERVWIIDPLDGTVNYAHEYPVFAVSVALQVAGELVIGAVYNPLLDDMYAARRGGGATLNGRPRHVTEVDSLERAFLATGFGYDVATEPDLEKNNLGPFARFVRAAQAVRRAGSAALAIAKVGVGRTDGFWELGLHPWDMAAAMLVVEEGGGRISNLAGGPPALDGKQLVATNGRVHGAILEVLGARSVPSTASAGVVTQGSGTAKPDRVARK